MSLIQYLCFLYLSGETFDFCVMYILHSNFSLEVESVLPLCSAFQVKLWIQLSHLVINSCYGAYIWPLLFGDNFVFTAVVLEKPHPFFINMYNIGTVLWLCLFLNLRTSTILDGSSSLAMWTFYHSCPAMWLLYAICSVPWDHFYPCWQCWLHVIIETFHSSWWIYSLCLLAVLVLFIIRKRLAYIFVAVEVWVMINTSQVCCGGVQSIYF